MIFARDEKGNLVEASRNEFGETPRGFCPCCGKQLTARVGEVRRPHWAHESGERCDEWWEEESEWRTAWMEKLRECPALDLQNTLEKEGVRHFYDVKDGESRIWVFRRTRLSTEQVTMREQFFGQMLWFVEAKESEYRKFVVVREKLLSRKIAPQTYYWGRYTPPFSSRWADCSMPVLFDFASASADKETSLWCILGNKTNAVFVLEFRREDLLKRICCNGRLFQWDLPAVFDKLMTLSETFRAHDEESLHQRNTSRNIVTSEAVAVEGAPDPASTVDHMIPDKECLLESEALSQQQETPPATFEERVTHFEKLGFNRADAIARAKIGIV